MGFSSLLVGDESLLVQCAETLTSRGHTVAGIVTDAAPIRDYAQSRAISCFGRGPELAARLSGLSFDWLFSAANLTLIPQVVWSQARAGAANFHDGPLPRHAGLNAPAWAILEREETHGVAWHTITDGIDEGGILTHRSFPVAPDDTAFMLNTRCFAAGIESFAELVERIESGSAVAQPQSAEGRSYHARADRPAIAGTLALGRPASELDATVRALDFGPGYRNPLVTAKLLLPEGPLPVSSLAILPADQAPFGALPGTVISAEGQRIRVMAADTPVEIELAAQPATLPAAGEILPHFEPSEAQALDADVAQAARHEPAMLRRLAAARDLDLFGLKPAQISARASDIGEIDLPLPASLGPDERIAAVAAFLLLKTQGETASLGFSDAPSRETAGRFPGYFLPTAPLNVAAGDETSWGSFAAAVTTELAALRRAGAPLADLPAREPSIAAVPLSVAVLEGSVDPLALPEGAALAVHLAEDGASRLLFDRDRLSQEDAADIAARLALMAQTLADNRPALLADLRLMSGEEAHRLLVTLNDTARPLPAETTLHALVEAQVARTPDAPAVTDGETTLTYRELDAHANRIAHGLLELGVQPGAMVGLHLHRTVWLVAGALAIAKAGAAYVPLDPMFPAERLAYMVEDSGAPIVLGEHGLIGTIAAPGVRFAAVEDLAARNDLPRTRPDLAVGPDSLAYVIYTSGSTGRPKGVMLEHGNVANFFAGMDERVPATTPDGSQPVWLAVTSLSFDISVLELFWTLARGFKVVIHSPQVRAGASHKARRKAKKPGDLDFSLFFWGSNAGSGSAKYRLLLDSARFADEHGFSALWMPERHFHAFGGGFPNPAVTAAAVAAITRNIGIRAGSCVLPLHHPLRVAEEWAVIDNLSDGRVGIAFASGWMPEDFVLRPENTPPANRHALLRDIETVRRLWRGESLEFPFAEGRNAAVVTQPRPVQAELPVWVTTAGNPETWREAARLGANVLTHLLGQSVAEVAEKIALYRQTLRETGRDPADHKVVLMLHTLLGEDRDLVREEAREPMKAYLQTAASLIKQYAWAFPAFKKPAGTTQAAEIDLQSLAPDEMDAILEFAFLRYFDESGFFGTVEDAVGRAEALSAAGVDEIACLVDFGVPDELALERLGYLAEVVAARSGGAAEAEPVSDGIAGEIARHGVTHLQATPSMMRMFLLDDESGRALAGVRHLFVGGEAFPATLLAELRAVTAATIENMYGPTETTIWSSTMRAEIDEGVVPLGAPIANTQLYVLDASLRLLPPGTPGELCIGGLGVARGYHGRPELTAERFVANPFAPGRIYRTGDLVLRERDGTLRFLGRTDHQVKVRGYRIELGEIEERIEAFPGVAQAVVTAREDQPGDVRLVAYLRCAGARVDEEALRASLAAVLPSYMVPAHMMVLDAFPLTPNAKVDRKALPKPGAAATSPKLVAPAGPPAATPPAATGGDMEQAVAQTFARVLGLESVAPTDNFFLLGGHSLLAVQAHRELKAGVAPQMAITDLFRFPTVQGLAAHLGNRTGADDRLAQVAARAAQRRAALGNRRAGPERAREHG